ncbi:MAG: cell division protein ZapA [Granulosicoccus sp.]|nr:cell division protein ZapA [Granulosicoccus sp.]
MKPAKESKTVKVRILDKEVQIGCSPGDEEALARAAQFVDMSMRDFRGRNVTASVEKIALITAINTANELLKNNGGSENSDDVAKRLSSINAELDAILQSN